MAERFNIAAYAAIMRAAHAGELHPEAADRLLREHTGRGMNKLERRSVDKSDAARVATYKPRTPAHDGYGPSDGLGQAARAKRPAPDTSRRARTYNPPIPAHRGYPPPARGGR
jgi:hypothetical protein